MEPGDKLAERILILRCQLRDRQALAELIDRYARPIRYFIRRLVGDPDLAEELCQETWLAVIRRVHTLENPERFTVWLYRIARNRVYQELRLRHHTLELYEGIAGPCGEEEESPPFDDVARVHRGLSLLGPLQREVLMLRFIEQMSYEEIAAVLDCNIGTVRSRIHHAKRALREKLEEES